MLVHIVEDDLDIARSLEMLLGARHIHATTTTEAFDTLLDPAPWEGVDVAIIDLLLPGIRGDEIAAYVRHLRPEIRIVMFTAVGEVAEWDRSVADVVLLKPASMDEIVEAIRGHW